MEKLICTNLKVAYSIKEILGCPARVIYMLLLYQQTCRPLKKESQELVP